MQQPWHRRLTSLGRRVFSFLKPYLRWLILGATLFFLASALKKHWAEVIALRIEGTGWADLALSLGVTLLAHIWSGWVWSWILRELNQPAKGGWGVLVYLKTNIAKYLPGNVWHLYGRVVAAKNAGFSSGAATLSVLLEPLLMAAAALAIALATQFSNPQPLEQRLAQLLSLTLVLAIIHPRLLNPLLKFASRLKGKPNQAKPEQADNQQKLQIKRYPLLPLSGEIVFVGLRGVGFLLALLSLSAFDWAKVPAILSAFSFAWLLGLVIPGAPGGIGVFEATAIALLHAQLPPALILGSVALYRLISTLAEAGGAGLAWLDAYWNQIKSG